MKRPHFKSCNHGCLAKEAKGQSTNGGCTFPSRLDDLREECILLWGYHHDKGIRKFARKVAGLIDHISMEEGTTSDPAT
jgi:hypothetical protein